jgi:hypothetical protein
MYAVCNHLMRAKTPVQGKLFYLATNFKIGNQRVRLVLGFPTECVGSSSAAVRVFFFFVASFMFLVIFLGGW